MSAGMRLGRRAPVVGAGLVAALAGAVVWAGASEGAGTPAHATPPRQARVEIKELRTRSSETFAGRDGVLRTRVFGGAVNFQADDGSWQRIDSRLRLDGDVLRNTANDYEVQLPTGLGDEPVRVQDGSRWVSFGLRDASGAAAATGATATYADARPGVDVRYEARAESVKEELVLADAKATRVFTFDLDASGGLTPRLRGAGTLEFRDARGRVRMVAAAPLMTDADGAVSRAVPSELVRSGDGWRLVLHADDAWLDAAGRKFPVTIDPTVYPNADVDCGVASGTPSTSLCGDSTFEVGSDGAQRHNALLRFDVRSALAPEAQIQHAAMGIQMVGQTGSVAKTIRAFRATRDFTSSATWNTYDGTNAWTTPGGDFATSPAAESDPSVGGAGTEGTWYVWDVRRMVDGWINGTLDNHGVVLTDDGSSVDNTVSFASTEAGTGNPYIDVLWTRGLGSQPGYKLESWQLNDRTTLNVNAANGNVLLQQRDLTVPGGLGPDFTLSRSYNSLSYEWFYEQAFGEQNWNLDTAGDVRLSEVRWSDDVGTSNDVIFNGPSGYRQAFAATGDSNGKRSYQTPEGMQVDLVKDLSTDEWTLTDRKSQGKLVFDEIGRLIRQEDRNGRKIQFAYDGWTHRVITVTDSQGRDTALAYNGDGQLETMTDPAGREYHYGYTDGRLTSYTDPNGGVTHYAYDGPAERLSKITTPGGRETDISYYDWGDPNEGRVQSVTRVQSPGDGPDQTWNFDYNVGWTSGTAAVTDPIGVASSTAGDRETHYEFDGLLRTAKTTDAIGREQRTEYTTTGQVDQVFAPYNTGTTTATASIDLNYDSDDNLTQTLQQVGGGRPRRESTATYGESGRFPAGTPGSQYLQTAGVNVEGRRQRMSYDDHGNPNQIEQRDNANTTTVSDVTLNYDPNSPGKLISSEDGNGNVTTYAYDTGGNLTSIDPSGAIVATTLNYGGASGADQALSRPTYTQGPNGRRATYTYDDLDRITQVTYSVNGVTESTVDNTYDADGNLTGRDDSSDGTTTYDYNGLGQLAYELYPSGHHNAYTYDRAGNLTDLTDNDGSTGYSYDDVNRLASLTEPGASTPITYTYDDDNDYNRRTVIRPNGTVSIERYNKAEQMLFTCTRPAAATTACDASTGTGRLFSEFYSYIRDGVDEPSSLLWSTYRADSRAWAYRYDELGRLVIAQTGPNGGATVIDDRWQYAYDPAGNMIQSDHNGSARSMAYNTANQLCQRVASGTIPTSCTPVAGAETFAYDDTGNLTTQTGGAGLAFTYNARNQITNVLEGSSLILRSFAGPGQAEQTSLGSREIDNNALGVAKIGDERFTRTPDGELVSQQGGTPGHRYYQLDRQGSVRQQVSTTGTIITQTSYDPYGLSRGPDNPGQPGLWFGYTGGQTDTAGLIHNGQRYYSPDLMRWTQPDPIHQPADLGQANRYTYVDGDPINRFDPTGALSLRKVLKRVAGGVAVVGGAAITAACIVATEGIEAPHCVIAGGSLVVGGAILLTD